MLQTIYNCSELMEALQSIQKVIQCYTCHKRLQSVRICLDGHGFCWDCKNRCNNNCPICCKPILNSKPVILNEIIKMLPKTCKYSGRGCDSLILPLVEEHENFCRFRQTYCRMSSCNWKGVAKDLLMHLEKYHGNEMIRTATQTKILMAFNASVDKEGLSVIVAYNNIFWQHVRVKHNQLLQFYQYVPMARPTDRFVVNVSFHTPDVNYCSTTPVHTDMFHPAQLFKDKETFALPTPVALSFNQFHSGVHFTFNIIKLDA